MLKIGAYVEHNGPLKWQGRIIDKGCDSRWPWVVKWQNGVVEDCEAEELTVIYPRVYGFKP